MLRRAFEGESTSALITGPPGCGKFVAVETAVTETSRAVAVRLRGADYSDERSCMRDLYVQLSRNLRKDFDVRDVPLARRGSFAVWVSRLQTVLQDSSRAGFVVLVVLKNFEIFVHNSRQSMLYNLFDLMQAPGVRLVCVGLTQTHGISDHLEKRIKSRFQLRGINLLPPASAEQLAELMTAIFAPSSEMIDSEIAAIFRARETLHLLEQHVNEGIVSVGKMMKNFAQVIITANSIDQVRAKLPHALDAPGRTSAAALLRKELRVVDHVLISALVRMHKLNKRPKTFAALCSEISVFEKSSASNHIVRFTRSAYFRAFLKLRDLGVIQVSASAAHEAVPLAFCPCRLAVLDAYTELLERPPDDLKFIPSGVTSWASDTLYKTRHSQPN